MRVIFSYKIVRGEQMMIDPDSAPAGSGPLDLDPQVLEALREGLPAVAEHTVAAVTAEVPEYSRSALSTDMASNIEGAVLMALATFLRVAEGRDTDPGPPLAPALEAAYALGRGEARTGRTMDGLLAAYRVGARVAWRDLAAGMVQRDVPAATVARFAELVFSYIDELSAASAAGHRDELATTGRVREQYLERLGQALLDGESADELAVRAERADWPAPNTLTVVVLPAAHLRSAILQLDPRTLVVAGDIAGIGAPEDTGVLLVPDVHRSRAALLSALEGRSAVIGPIRPWTKAVASYRRVLRAMELLPMPTTEPLDTDEHLVTLVLGADGDALGDLRARALQPLASLRPAAARRLEETLRSWLLHQGRRDDVAADLHVHPQTVRYRMTQLRELFGERLTDARGVLELVVALALPVP